VYLMDGTVFDGFRRLVYERSGIALREGKEALVSARISKRMRELGIDDPRSYLRYVTEDESGGEMVRLIDVISTNVTSFFREYESLDFFGRVVAGWLAEGQRRFRFWSAACSSGEEPYSMAMIFHEVLKEREADMKILATDISTRVLDRAAGGVYDERRLKNVPRSLIQKYFDRTSSGPGAACSVKRILKERIVFARLNLSTPPFPMKGPFDVVFCRNVMIYFDTVVRRNLLAEIHRLLAPGGYLIVGSAESLAGLMSDFRAVRPSVYLKE